MGRKETEMSVGALKKNAAENKAARTATPQTKRTPGRTDEVRNNAGGFVFTVSDKDRLERFLILGTDGGTYYVGERDLTKQNLGFVKTLIAKDERLVIDTLVDIAVKNRAAKNSPSLYVLALVLAEGVDKDYFRASGVFNQVVRTSTHLFEFANYVDSIGGWGRAKRNAIAGWYTSKDAGALAYQAVKYRQREGWTHRDLFRKVHPQGVDATVGNFILGKGLDPEREGVDIIEGYQRMSHAGSVKEVIAILNDYKSLPWETIPTQFLTDADVWKTLFYNGALGQTALLRNITRFEKIGAFRDIKFAGDVAKALANKDAIVKGRVHPVAYANALGIYRDGQVVGSGVYWGGDGRKKDWTTNAKVLGGLEAGFYESFATVEPANKVTMVSIDTSGSMTWGAPAGLVGMDYMGAAAAMAMVLVRTEPYVEVNAFTTSLRNLKISDKDSLETVDKKIRAGGYGGTDCSQPMIYATKTRSKFDTFTVWTDNETWAGNVKPSQALVNYRKQFNPDARLAVVALAGTQFTIADPKDKGMMDFVGFDASAPKVLADFSAGRI
jgi:60 kDa SS-A/Ro ribonucleoprotein